MDDREIETWVAEHGDALLRYAHGRVGQLPQAEDLVQETFLSAFRSRDQFHRQSSERTWLIAILRRKIVDHYRKLARSPQHEATSDDWPFDQRGIWNQPLRRWKSDPSSPTEQQELLQTLADCINKLGPTLRAAFQFRVVDDLKTEEVCSLLKISATNLSVRLTRARIAIRQCLDIHWFERE